MISARMIGTAAFGMLLGLVGTMPSGHAEPVRSEPSTTTPSATAVHAFIIRSTGSTRRCRQGHVGNI